MAADRISEEAVGEIQIDAAVAAERFTKNAKLAPEPRQAADWSQAARNAISVALTCEQIVTTRRSPRR